MDHRGVPSAGDQHPTLARVGPVTACGAIMARVSHERPGHDGSVNQRSVLLLGSTGSIGTQAIDVIRRNPDRFAVVGISAGGADPVALARQAVTLGVRTVAVADADAAPAVLAEITRASAAAGLRQVSVELLAGPQAATELAGREVDVVLNGITGSGRAARSRSRTRSPSSSAAGWSRPRSSGRTRSSRWTPSTRRSPSRCAPVGGAR